MQHYDKIVIYMLKRKIFKSIGKWYKNSKSALLIDGARQIGKTTIIEEFLKTNGTNFIEFNLLENKLALEAFNTSFDDKQLILRLSSLTNKSLIENETIIFIDEIQEANDAITPIKFLVRNNKYRFIFSGSLLGVKMKEIVSIPVGFLTIMQMYPMDFEEFCTAIGVSPTTLDYLRACLLNKNKVDDIVHKQMLNLFHIYLAVGGMPNAVVTYLESNDMSKVNRILNDIDTGYMYDISKYNKKDKFLLQEIYNLIPSELNSNNKRFILKNLNEKARFYQYETSFAWIKNSGVGLFIHNVDNIKYPLLASKERTLFKLFLNDVGLLTNKLYKGNKFELLKGDSTLNFGAVYENVVAQELIAHGYDLYYNNDKKRGEIDFLIEEQNEIIPIEVKSGKDYKRHSALNQLVNNKLYSINKAYVLCNKNIEVKDKIIYIPIYMISFFDNFNEDKPQKITLDISKLI